MKNAHAYRDTIPFDVPAATRLVRPSSAAKTLARIMAVASTIILLGLFALPWQQNSQARGRVIAFAAIDRQQNIDAPVEGRIVKWLVQEGDKVREGQEIVEIADNDPAILDRLGDEKEAIEARIDAAKSRVVAVDARIDALMGSRASALSAAESRVRMARDRVRAAEQTVLSAEAARRTADLNMDRLKKLHEEGLQSKRALELAELDLVRTSTDLDRARAALAAARSEEIALASDQVKVGNDMTASINDANATKATALAEIANGAAELARMEVRMARQATQRVTAPRAGAIFRIVAKQGGDFVKSSDTLAILVPDTDDRAVELWIDGNDINLVRVGRKVRLQFEGWPAVQFSGWPSAAVGTYGGHVAIVDALDDGQGRFRVVVTPDPTDHTWPDVELLRQGTRANGWVLFDRVSLGYELWRQYNGFPPEWPASSADLGQGKGGKGGEKGGKK